LRGSSVMLNIIGHIPARESVLAVEGAHLHLYGKAPTEKRKVGHVTLVGRTATELEGATIALEALVEGPPGAA
jgi:5-(carboxyamino)imidazole ribonucleotide synthase